jgi:hypothetical protein
MKKIILGSMVAVAAMGAANAQEKVKDGTISSGDAASEASAVLELESNNKGFLPPRLTTAQRDAVTTWPEGSLIYNTTTKAVEYYNGTAWTGFTGAVLLRREHFPETPVNA